jgi:hypothetical protein
VACQADPTSNQFQTSGNDFVSPEATTLETVRVTTGADGTATLPGGSLVNGADYTCSVFLPSSFHGTEVQTSGFGFEAGVDQPQLFFDLHVSGSGVPLFAVRSNNDNESALLGLNASMVITLNQPAEFVPGSEDCQTASLTNPNTNGNADPAGVLPTDVPGNGASEQVAATVSADGLTLTVTNKPYVTVPDTGDFGTFITFSGIYLRPRDAALKIVVVNLGGGGNGGVGCDLATAWGSSTLENFHTGSAQTNQINLF